MSSKIARHCAVVAAVLLLFNCSPAIRNSDEPEIIGRSYNRYQEPAITTRLFKHNDIEALIQKHVNNGLLQKEIIGQSAQGRNIYHLTAGKGKTKVLLWSQMHGDEATATMALFDLFNFLSASDRYDRLRKMLFDKLEMHFVPMLNPDGAEIWTRRNAMNIDLNRDAQNLATPEARALMALAKRLGPQFGFNLHDQSTLYAAGKNTRQPATISFLAPAYNVAKDMNPVRRRAVQVITSMNRTIREMIPSKVAKYNDTFDGSCFGDTFQGMGISTILIESGGYPDDPDKQYIRKVNFYALLTALQAIATETYTREDEVGYWSLPNNNNTGLNHLLIRNLNAPVNGKEQPTDIGINRSQLVAADLRTFVYSGHVARLGKLDSIHGYTELDASGLTYSPGRTITLDEKDWRNLDAGKELDLLRQGYLFVRIPGKPLPAGPVKNRLLNIDNGGIQADLAAGKPANFLLNAADGRSYAVVNGYLVDLSAPAAYLPNSMAY